MTLVFKVYVDFDADGAWTTAGDDLSAYWVSHNITAGIQGNTARVANAGRCTVVLQNESRIFSPEYTSGTYYGKLLPGLPFKLDVVQDGGAAVTLFRGVTSRWQPASGHIDGPRTCVLECIDLIGQLQAASVAVPLQENETPKRIIEKITATAFDGASATGTLTYSATPNDGDTVTVGSTVYTYKTTLTGAANEVLIGALVSVGGNRDTSARNLSNAINADTGAGTTYGTGTVRHAYITADALPFAGVLASEKDADYTLRKDTGYDGLATALQFNTGFTTDTLYIYLKKAGTPTGTMTVRIETSGGVTPSGILVDSNATVTLSEAALSTSYGWIAVTFPASINFMKYRRLFLVLSTNRLASATDYVVWGGATTGSLAATKTGSTWTSVPGDGLVFIFNGRVSLSANAPGTWGNALALAETGTAVTVSAAALAGGTDAPSGLVSADTGLSTIALAGDTWREGQTNALTALDDVVKSEYGLAWVSRAGVLTIADRDCEFAQAAAASALTTTNQMNAMQGEISLDTIYNAVTVDYTARIEESTGVIARANGSIEVKPGVDSTVTTLQFIENTTGDIMGAKNAIVPVASTDYTVTDYTPSYGETYVGFDYTNTGNISIKMTSTASGVDLTFSNAALGPLFVNDLQVRGTVLVKRNQQQIATEDATSITAYEKRSHNISLPFPTAEGTILSAALAAHILSRYKDPKYRLSSITYTNQEKVNGVSPYTIDIGENITINETQTAVSGAKYMVQGWQHSASVRRDHSIVWNLRELGALTYWLLADATYGVLGSTTRLGLGGGNYASGYADGNVVGVVDFNQALRDDANALYAGAPRLWTHYHDESTVTNGNPIVVTIDTNQMHRFYAAQTAAANGDSFTFSAVLAPGWISVEIWLVKLPSGGQYKVVMDDIYTIMGTEDSYAAAPTYNTDYVGAGAFYFTETTRHKFEVTVTGKHASSSGYTLAISHIDIWST